MASDKAADPLADVAALPGVADAVGEAREAVDRLRGHPILRRRAADVAAETALRGARASAALDGVAWTLEEVRAVDRRRRAGAAVVYGALRAVAAVPELVSPFQRAPRQVLARLHALAGAGLSGEEELGRPRTDESAALAGRLDALTSLLTTETSSPASVVAAVAHGELLAMAPFASCNGVVARAVQRLVLRSRGLDPSSLAAPEVGHLDQLEDYVAASRGYVDGGAEGVATWVVHCAHAITAGAQEGLAVCESLARG